MKGTNMPKKIVLFAMVATFLVMGGVVIAQDRPPQSTNQDVLPGNSTKGDTPQVLSDQDLQLFRKDVRSLKKQIVAANMDLTDAQAEKFWPIYDQYAVDTAKINDTKAVLIQEYAQNYDTMTGDQAESYLKKRAAVEESIMQLRVKYIPTFRKVLSGRETALFFQLDWRLGLMIDLQLAQMPLINP
jgi:Spy/CpxP family protein refolding chaperone